MSEAKSMSPVGSIRDVREIDGSIGWSIQLWNGSSEGVMIDRDDVTGCIGLHYLLLRAEAEDQKISRHMTRLHRMDDNLLGKKQDDDVLCKYMGLYQPEMLRSFLKKALLLLEGEL